jgi:hypothetical protein
VPQWLTVVPQVIKDLLNETICWSPNIKKIQNRLEDNCLSDSRVQARFRVTCHRVRSEDPSTVSMAMECLSGQGLECN